MALPTVDINKRSGNSGRPSAGFDHYSGLVFYGTAPVVTGKWNTFNGTPNIKAQQLFSAGDAVTAGIIANTDNVAASAIYEITAAATAAGEKLPISIDFPLQNSGSSNLNLGTYTTVSGDTVIDTLGANLVTFINNSTAIHGCTASYDSAANELTITAPKYFGVSLNDGNPLVVDESNTTISGTITQFSGGTASQYAIWYYHIKEYFRKNPNGNVWVCIISAPSTFNELKTLQTVAAGSKIRQFGIYDKDATRGSAANIKATILQIQTALGTFEKTAPAVAVYSPNIAAVSDLSTYPDQNSNTANLVQCVISQDGDNEGALLFVRSGQTIGNVGIKLATIAISRVSASDAQPNSDFNNTDGSENNVPAFGNGVLSVNVSASLQAQLDSYNYTFFRQFGDTIVGTYWTGNKTCITATSEYANVNDNRVAQKVSRICYSAYTPLLASELIFNADGTLKSYTVDYFEDKGTDAITADMITGYGALPLISGVSVYIDKTQPVKQTSNLIIDVTIIENGIARNITVNIGYGTTI